MIEYIKMIILALISGVTFALPVSSSAHFSFLNSVLNFSEDIKVLGFYYSVMSVAFALVIFWILRKIYVLCLKSIISKSENLMAYRKVYKNILISLLPTFLLFIPIGEGKVLCDLFDDFLTKNNLLLVSFASILGALILVIAVWYAKQSYSTTKRSADTKTVIRSSVYQIVSYVTPGLSHVSSASTNMLLCDVESKVVVREIYLFIAPQMLLVNVFKIVRYILFDVIINPMMIVICVLVVALMCTLVVTKMSKINIRRLFVFFAVYSSFTGVVFAVLSFLLK